MLDKYAETRIRSAFIFALEEIEEEFGDLWGIDKAENEVLTEDEKMWLEKYLLVRKNILDYGNGQIRMLYKAIRKQK